jgi:hypothetical protein
MPVSFVACTGSMVIGKPVLAPPASLGWAFIVAVTLGTAAYVGGGIAVGKRSAAAAPSPGGSLGTLRLHPHFPRWLEIHGLVADGLIFARGNVDRVGERRSKTLLQNARRCGKQDYGAVAASDDGHMQEHERKERTKNSKRKKDKPRPGSDEGSSRGNESRGRDSRQKNRKEEEAAPAPVASTPVLANGTAAGGGGRWIHVAN